MAPMFAPMPKSQDNLGLELLVDGDHYVLPLERVEEVALRVPLMRVPGFESPLLGLLVYRGEVAVAVDLRARVGLSPRQPSDRDHFVIVRAYQRAIALVVDRALGLLSMRETSVQDAHQTATVAGVCAMGPDLKLVYNLDALLGPAQLAAVDRAIETASHQTESDDG